MKNYLKILMTMMGTVQLPAAAVEVMKYDDLKPKVFEAINLFKKKLETLGSDDVYKCFLWENLTPEKMKRYDSLGDILLSCQRLKNEHYSLKKNQLI